MRVIPSNVAKVLRTVANCKYLVFLVSRDIPESAKL